MSRFFPTLLLATAVAGAAAAVDAPIASDVLSRMGFGPRDLQRVLDGEFVRRDVKSDAKDDLAVALSFLVRVPPERFDHDLTQKAFVFKLDPNTLGGDAIAGHGSLADFSGLTLSAAERSFYAHTSAGDAINLSAAELAVLGSLDGAGPDVDAAMKKILLARYRAYRAKGLAGIAPYDRGHGKSTDPAVSLRLDAESAQALTDFDPALTSYLLGYPRETLPGLTEKFYWLRYRAHGEPVLVLTHAFSVPIGRWSAFGQRQYYVSRGYNSEQAIALFLPVVEGTLVVYLNHTSTDQVLGFGGSAKRAIGERVMLGQLEELFGKLRDSAAKSQ